MPPAPGENAEPRPVTSAEYDPSLKCRDTHLVKIIQLREGDKVEEAINYPCRDGRSVVVDKSKR
jgi:hypothetical protein